jgi:lipid II:glycine glycyltransferase (peptidoglycan interpeptide bridge formation enzyme)
VIVQRRTDQAGLERFYRLHLQTRRQQGVPTQPRRFILRFAELFQAGLGFVLLASQGGRDAAGAVFLAAGGTLTYKYGASDRRLLSVRPNNLLFMEAIRWGCENGQQVLDFGRTDLENEGLRAFKRGWGAQESPLRYTLFSRRPTVPGPSRTDVVLRPIIKRAPAVVGRLIGEALYRHVG